MSHEQCRKGSSVIRQQAAPKIPVLSNHQTMAESTVELEQVFRRWSLHRPKIRDNELSGNSSRIFLTSRLRSNRGEPPSSLSATNSNYKLDFHQEEPACRSRCCQDFLNPHQRFHSSDAKSPCFQLRQA